jgi:uncharacterized metal-binding protein (TIGR02443 family)
MYQKRRFIAGAVCPRCNEMDKLVIYGNEEGLFRECVSCGYKDKQAEAEASSPELSTRVNYTPEKTPENVVPLKFYSKKTK